MKRDPSPETVKTMPDRVFQELKRFVSEKTGIQIPDRNKEALHVSLLERMSFHGLPHFQDYLDLLLKKEAESELRHLVDLVTVNETHFFRNKAQMSVLREHVIPEISRRKDKKVLTIWSAGCATGEEPYSIAILLSEMRAFLAGWAIELIGSDISQGALKAAEDGIYRERAVRDVDEGLLRKYFTRKNNRYEICDAVKRMVTLRCSNLIKEMVAPTLAPQWDVLFCRNVMIYFGSETRFKVVDAFHRCLAQESYFFLGHSETLMGVHEGFRLEDFGASLIYRPISSTPERKPASLLISHPSPSRFPSQSEEPERAKSPQIPPPPVFSETEEREALHELGDLGRDRGTKEGLVRVVALANRGEYEPAMEVCREVLALQPRCEEAHFLFGVIFEQLAFFSRALLHFNTAVTLDPGFSMAYFRRAEVEEKLGKRPQAVESYRQALKTLKGRSSSRVKLGHGISSELLEMSCQSKLKELALSKKR